MTADTRTAATSGLFSTSGAEAPDVENAYEHSHPHESRPPTIPSRAVMMNVGVDTGGLVLSSVAECEGIEVEIYPIGKPLHKTHVWVLPREGRDKIVYAAIFPRLDPGEYAILATDGSVAKTLNIPANVVTRSSWP